MNILVTGGAGYIGSIVTESLINAGHSVIVTDNLSTGHRGAVHRSAILHVMDYSSEEDMYKLLTRMDVDTVVHMAGETLIGESTRDPGRFFVTNTAKSISMLQAMRKAGVRRLVFSSTAAVYGQPSIMPISESIAPNPINAYGESKWMLERVLNWYSCAYDLRAVSLRYFNVIGASRQFGEDHRPETHLVPRAIQACLSGSQFCLFGDDYPTHDGSCIRDYIDVVDLAAAHLRAVERLDTLPLNVYNMGSAKGYSNLEVLGVVERVVGRRLKIIVRDRRPGDPSELVACSELAQRDLGWLPDASSLELSVTAAVRWLIDHPKGYGDN